MQEVLLKCVDEIESEKILRDMHEGVCGGHYMDKITTHKILRVGFWQTTLFKDAQEFVKSVMLAKDLVVSFYFLEIYH